MPASSGPSRRASIGQVSTDRTTLLTASSSVSVYRASRVGGEPPTPTPSISLPSSLTPVTSRVLSLSRAHTQPRGTDTWFQRPRLIIRCSQVGN